MRRRKSRLGLIFVFLCFCIAVFALGSLWLLKGGVRHSAPLYEEAYSGSDELAGTIRKIDFSVYDVLYRSGIPEKSVVFLEVGPRDAGGEHWEFTNLLVRCPDGAKARNLRDRMLKGLSRLGPRVMIRREKAARNAVSFSILVNGFRTHRIVLSFGAFPHERGKERARIALIIDDLGYDSRLAEGFMNLKIPVSLSILPDAPFTRSIADEARRRGCELMVHLPMEPKRYPAVNSGPGTLFVSMDTEQILHQLSDDLDQVPGATGVNNHMGSLFTENRDKMMVVLQALKRRHLFFVDSRTTADSVGYDLARKMGIPTAKRTVFLDNDLHPEAIRSQVRRLLNMARHKGWAIGIGHPHKETLKLLQNDLSGPQDGVEIVPVSKLLG
jgi:uncharacterized protein